jgi:hypothetical protein
MELASKSAIGERYRRILQFGTSLRSHRRKSTTALVILKVASDPILADESPKISTLRPIGSQRYSKCFAAIKRSSM